MSDEKRFPIELLNCSISEKVQYFQKHTTLHHKLREASEKLIQQLSQPAGASLVFVFGPSGVGKSTLLRNAKNLLIKSALSSMEVDKSYIPVAGVEATAPDSGNFDWKDFYIRALQALDEPLINKKISRMDTSRALRLSLESALRNRKTDAFLIDEAQHLSKMTSGRRLLDQIDCIKSIANVVETQFILCGTYELLSLRDLSGQLCRRNIDIHFPRYKADSEEDLKTFKSTINTFQRYLPLQETPNLINDWSFCYERSIGCIGILKDWLTRTLNGVLEQNPEAKTISTYDLERYAIPAKQCLVMLKETREGEKKLEDEATAASSLREQLGLEPPHDRKEKSSKTNKEIQKKRGKVGQPSPVRRPVGVEENVN